MVDHETPLAHALDLVYNSSIVQVQVASIPVESASIVSFGWPEL